MVSYTIVIVLGLVVALIVAYMMMNRRKCGGDGEICYRENGVATCCKPPMKCCGDGNSKICCGPDGCDPDGSCVQPKPPPPPPPPPPPCTKTTFPYQAWKKKSTFPDASKYTPYVVSDVLCVMDDGKLVSSENNPVGPAYLTTTYNIPDDDEKYCLTQRDCDNLANSLEEPGAGTLNARTCDIKELCAASTASPGCPIADPYKGLCCGDGTFCDPHEFDPNVTVCNKDNGNSCQRKSHATITIIDNVPFCDPAYFKDPNDQSLFQGPARCYGIAAAVPLPPPGILDDYSKRMLCQGKDPYKDSTLYFDCECQSVPCGRVLVTYPHKSATNDCTPPVVSITPEEVWKYFGDDPDCTACVSSPRMSYPEGPNEHTAPWLEAGSNTHTLTMPVDQDVHIGYVIPCGLNNHTMYKAYRYVDKTVSVDRLDCDGDGGWRFLGPLRLNASKGNWEHATVTFSVKIAEADPRPCNCSDVDIICDVTYSNANGAVTGDDAKEGSSRDDADKEANKNGKPTGKWFPTDPSHPQGLPWIPGCLPP